MAGPVSTFNECYNPATDDVVDGVWTGELTDVAAPEGWLENPADCPDEVEEPTEPADPTEPEEGQFDDIVAACGAQIGAGVACFTTSQEPACEGFDPMSLLAGDLPVPTDCDGGPSWSAPRWSGAAIGRLSTLPPVPPRPIWIWIATSIATLPMRRLAVVLAVVERLLW